MEFIKEIRLLENTSTRKETYMTSLGSTEVLLTTLELTQNLNDNNIYIESEFLKAITRYVAAYTDSSYFIKLRESDDENLNQLQEYIEKNAIKLVIDINALEDNDQDIIIKPINKNIDKTILQELKEVFIEENITKVQLEEPLNVEHNIDVIEINISKNIRNIEAPNYLENLCNALINFISMYTNVTGGISEYVNNQS